MRAPHGLRFASSLAFLLAAVVPAAAAASGELDRSFSDDGRVSTLFRHWALTNAAARMAVGENGKAVVATEVWHRAGGFRTDPAIARYTRHGRHDRSFSKNGRLVLSTRGEDFDVDVAVQDDGRILIASDRLTTGLVTRLRPNGELDRSFGDRGRAAIDAPGLIDIVAIEVQPDGGILVAGTARLSPPATPETDDTDFAVVRLTRKGMLDPSFSADGIATIDLKSDAEAGAENIDIALDLALRPDGRIVVVGPSQIHDQHIGRSSVGVASLLPDGELDPSFGEGGISLVGREAGGFAVAAPADGSTVVGGDLDGDFAIGQFSARGVLEESFAGDGIATLDGGAPRDLADAVAVEPNGGIMLAGSTRGRDSTDFALLRILRSGVVDPLFAGDGIKTVEFGGRYDDADAVEARPNGRILVSGTVGNSRIGVARIRGG